MKTWDEMTQEEREEELKFYDLKRFVLVNENGTFYTVILAEKNWYVHEVEPVD